MHPVVRRILLHGGLTAAILALIGLLFAELAGIWLAGNAARGGPGADNQIGDELRVRVPLMLAFWGFVFVLVGELVIWRVRGNRAPATPPPQDDAEKLLNELLAQAEAKMAAEQRGEGQGGRGKEAEAGGQKEETEKPGEPPA